jgi:hypothetical protein
MSKCISCLELDDTIKIAHCNDGFWLYDTTRGMNLSLRAKSEQAAMFEALKYYQRRLKEVESSYTDLQSKVDGFVSLFIEDEED